MSLERLPGTLLRVEGAVLFGAALSLYLDGHYSLLALVLLFLAPDVSALGYVAGPRVGALAYDLVHTSATPIALGAGGVIADERILVQLALIWLAHIGIDRALAYGLKYPTTFRDSHLQRV